MGDRANVIFNTIKKAPNASITEFLDGSVVLYSHWGGYALGGDLAKALSAARGRWDDMPYGTRIIVSQLVGEQWKSETGFGLSVGEICDNEYPFAVVDFADKRVVMLDHRGTGRREYTFDQFAAMTAQEASVAHLGQREDA